ncbi:GNAT family N-acetyltransferase [Streptomyces oceani]|uniref:GNAT family N-acetyltransferase n=1 Tax=Streptomyces oceani TaxID=1075402 RepID=UPI001FCCCEFB|nr:GNAT family N-acetyltransferase [Streptomyces oceani]
MRILSFPEAATPPELRVQVVELQRQAWPSEDDGGTTGSGVGGAEALTHDPALRPLSLLLVDSDGDGGDTSVLAALDLLSKQLTHDGQRFAVGGLSTVVTRPGARRRGLGRHLVSAARERLAERLDLGLFSCDRVLQAFYEDAGWQPLEGAVLIGGTPERPLASDRPGFDKVVMADFFSPRARQARQSFPHARIELYPGDTDRLWGHLRQSAASQPIPTRRDSSGARSQLAGSAGCQQDARHE